MITANEHDVLENEESPSAQADPSGVRLEPANGRQPGFRTIALTGLCSSLLLWMCHFPLACGWLAWIALVPLLALVRMPARPRSLFFGAWLAGLAFFVPDIQWMSV